MRERASDKHPILFSVMLGVLLTLFIAIASTIATLLEFSGMQLVIAQGAAFLLMAIIITMYMRNSPKSLSAFGFQNFSISKSKIVLHYLPLLLIAVVNPVIGGLDTSLSVVEISLIALFSFLVGYTEECIFRGIMKEKLQSKGTAFFILFSSTFFGILHLANALSGKDLPSVILQVANAFLLGLILSLLITLVHNIIPLIIFHFLYDTLAIMTNSYVSSEKEILVLTILTVSYILYGIYLLFVFSRRTKVQSVQ